MKHSVKFKVTLWYSSIVTLVLALAIGGVLLLSEYNSTDNIKAELMDEVGDLTEDLLENPLYSSEQDLLTFFDDDIMLSIYDENGAFANGIVPDDFPTAYIFESDELREVTQGAESWLIYDHKMQDNAGKIWWIRGIYSYGTMTRMIQGAGLLFIFLAPLLIGFTAFMGYRMVKKALQPIYTITDTVKEISHAEDLSKRLPGMPVKDEFSRLTETFNEMLSRLEMSFQSEKQFTSDAAHELRTPVSVMIAHCEYCLDELELSEEAREEIEIIYEKANRISKLVSQLLMLARAENRNYQLDAEEIDLEILAESVMEELEEKAAQKKIHFEFENHLENSVICGDMVLLTRLFMNLLDNAVIYGKRGGYAKLSLDEQDEKVRIRVEDNGVGIAPEDINKIWNRFYRGDKSRSAGEGFGLGLFMVRWIVEMHGGEIQVESKENEGTIFTVLLRHLK